MIEKISAINNIINSFVWGPYMLVLLIGTGVYMSIRTYFFQVKNFNIWAKLTYGSMFDKHEKGHNITPFQAVSVALASTIGIGRYSWNSYGDSFWRSWRFILDGSFRIFWNDDKIFGGSSIGIF